MATSDKQLMFDVGIYGRVSSGGRALSRSLEQWLVANGGRKMLYSQNTFTKSEFWNETAGDADSDAAAAMASSAMYERCEYEHLRRKYSLEDCYPDLYDKVCTSPDQTAGASGGSASSFFSYILSWLML